MGIDAYNQINKLYGTQTNIKTSRMQNSSVSMGKDQLSISQTGRDYQIAKNAVSEASDIREDKVAKLKAMVDSGSYSVKPEDFANKLLNAMM
ncbi:MAG: flagellar biosynthesis anti-sigma factor FlgM [Lachnospiraceae bacterium]|nr:flagellar biosynthesis anti-sigma factor FlgM [Lachnospiraceae bacterium]